MNSQRLYAIIILGLLLLPCYLGFLFNPAAAAPEIRVGVKVGDMVKYGDFIALWGSDVPGAVAPQNLIDINNTSYVVNTVLSVSGTTISFESRTLYLNGTEDVETKDVDVVSGNGSGNLTFVSAGLGASDKVYSIGNVTDARLNSTSLRSYCGLWRETNLLNTTQVFPDASMALWVEYYWDRATGMLAQQFWSYTQLIQGNMLDQGSIEYKMVDNNIWIGVPDSVPPTANAGPDQIVEVGNTTNFDAGASRDNVGIAKFFWDFGDGKSAQSLRAEHVYTKAGAYNVTLTVEDGSKNEAFDYVTVTVKDRPYSFPTTEVLMAVLAVLTVLLLAWGLSKRRRPKRRRR